MLNSQTIAQDTPKGIRKQGYLSEEIKGPITPHSLLTAVLGIKVDPSIVPPMKKGTTL